MTTTPTASLVRPAPSADLCLAIIARNEQANLPRCLASVSGLVREIVVVDTGSTDSTPEIALNAGARLLRHPWRDDFSEARNVALSMASADWILVLDADEELSPESRPALLPLLACSPALGLRLVVRNLQGPRDLAVHHDIHLTRIFRRDPAIRFEGAVHEQITPSIHRMGGLVLDTELVIIHHGYRSESVQSQDSRLSRNLRILTQAVARDPHDPYLRFQLGSTLKLAGDTVEAARQLELSWSLGAERLDPETRSLLTMRLGQLAMARNQASEALHWSLESLRLDPGNVVSLYLAGLASFTLGDLTQASRLLGQILENPCTNADNMPDIRKLLAACERLLTRT